MCTQSRVGFVSQKQIAVPSVPVQGLFSRPECVVCHLCTRREQFLPAVAAPGTRKCSWKRNSAEGEAGGTLARSRLGRRVSPSVTGQGWPPVGRPGLPPPRTRADCSTALCTRVPRVWGGTEDLARRPCGPPSLRRVVWSFQDVSFVCRPLMGAVLREG